MAKKVLVIEDDLKTQRVYYQRLSDEGYGVVLAATGSEAISSVKGQKPDLIILDIMLPGGMNGFDVLEQLKKDEVMKKIPVVVLTNLDTEAKVAKQIGAEGYLVKANVSIEDVIVEINQYLK